MISFFFEIYFLTNMTFMWPTFYVKKDLRNKIQQMHLTCFIML
jgi:hypothetical protein